MYIFYFALLSMGVFKLTEWTQELMPWTQKARFVSLTAAIFSFAAPALLSNDVLVFSVKRYLLWGFGLWGASALLHALESLLRAHKDLANSNWLKAQKSSRTPGW